MKFTPAELAETFAGTLKKVAEIFSAEGQPWMLIGGLAVGAWTEPRATKHIDFAISLPSDVEKFAKALADVGFAEAPRQLREVATEGGVVRLNLSGPQPMPIVVDLLCAGTDFERTALSRRRSLTVLGVSLFAASPDDLLIYKLIAGRPQDLADIDRLIRFGRVPEDLEYVRRFAREWGVEERFDAALVTARRDS
jgi:hypothetical protein